jgi:hypothetical protein
VKKLHLGLSALSCVLIASCGIRSHLVIDATDLTQGEIVAQISFDQQFRDAMEQFGGGGDLLGELKDAAPNEGWSVEPFIDGEFEGVNLSHSFGSIAELQELLNSAMMGSAGSGSYENLEFTETNDTIRFEATLSGTDPEMEGFDASQIADLLNIEFRVQITFPGEVIEHNGTLDGNTVTWDLDQDALAGAELLAEARKRGGFPWPVVLGVLLGLVVVAAVVWRVRSDRQKPEPRVVTVEFDGYSPENEGETTA